MTRSIDPLVSTDWLASRLAADTAPGDVSRSRRPGRLMIIDIREPHHYRAGHIPGAISIPFSPVSDWATSTDELMMELPDEIELLKVIGDHGITAESRVVIVTTLDKPPAPPYSLSDATRVAATLAYAGVKNVAILDGGHPKWVRESRDTSTELPEISPVTYSATVDAGMFVSTGYVKDRLGKTMLVDARDPEDYSGARVDVFAGKAGHIPTARSLPAIWLWRADGTYKPIARLREMATRVVGESKPAEIILYCGVGGYASSWWFVLTQLLGYTNVKIYDGAAEAWAKTNEMEVEVRTS